MAYDYDKLYGTKPQALGEPTQVIVNFFSTLKKRKLRVLDIGCGQGRDALFMARLGHEVVGVDISTNGIRDLNKTALNEGLAIDGIVDDLLEFAPTGTFDILLIDRTLHMLPEDKRFDALARLLKVVRPSGWVLIVDERSNMNGFKSVFEAHREQWCPKLEKGGTLFVQR